MRGCNSPATNLYEVVARLSNGCLLDITAYPVGGFTLVGNDDDVKHSQNLRIFIYGLDKASAQLGARSIWALLKSLLGSKIVGVIKSPGHCGYSD